MSSAASTSSSFDAAVSARAVRSAMEEHSVALSAGGVTDQHAAVAMALHLHTLQRRAGTKCVALTDEPTEALPEGKGLPTIPPRWSSNEDGFCFLYSVPSASVGGRPSRLLVKAIRMDRVLLVHACLEQPDGAPPKDILTAEINVDDMVDASALPGAASATVASGGAAAASSSAAAGDLSAAFRDLESLLTNFERTIVGKLLPNDAPSQQQQQQQQQRPDYWQGMPPGANPYPQNPRRPDEDDRPQGFDPLRVYQPRGVGPFASDIDPLSGGPGGGNLMGPRNFPFGGPAGLGGMGGRGGGMPGMAPRFDPYGPMPGMGDPDFDEYPPPGLGGPMGGLQQPRRGGFGGPGMGGPFGRGGGRGGGGMGGGGMGGGFGGPPHFM